MTLILKEIKFFFTLGIIVCFFLSLFLIHLYKVFPDSNTAIGNFEINYEQKGGDITVERILSKNKITCTNNWNIQHMTILYETVANGNCPS